MFVSGAAAARFLRSNCGWWNNMTLNLHWRTTSNSHRHSTYLIFLRNSISGRHYTASHGRSRPVTSGHVWSRLVTSGDGWSRLVMAGHCWSRLVTAGRCIRDLTQDIDRWDSERQSDIYFMFLLWPGARQTFVIQLSHAQIVGPNTHTSSEANVDNLLAAGRRVARRVLYDCFDVNRNK